MTRGPVVVGVDGSGASCRALHVARDAARKDRAEDGLDLVVVFVRSLPWSGVSGETVALASEAVDAMERDARALTERILDGEFITWRWEVRSGDPARELKAVAREVGARAIAVGGHKHGMLTSALVHSVDASLVHSYEGTLLIVRDGDGSPDSPVDDEVAPAAD